MAPTSDTPSIHDVATNQNALRTADVILLDHADLDAFITTAGGFDALPDSLTIYTEDSLTRGTVEFNLIVAFESGAGIGTQIHQPLRTAETHIDLRSSTNSFADWLQDLQ